MGTLATAISNARIRARMTDKNVISDTQALALVNSNLEDIRKSMVMIESNLVYAESTITTVDGTMEYTPSFSHDGFMDNGVWLDGEDWYLKQVNEVDKVKFDYATQTSEPAYYYFTEDGKVGFLHVPDDAYTVRVQFWSPLTTLTDVDNDDLPWDGIWNQYVEKRLEFEFKDILERDTSTASAILQMLNDQAMAQVHRRGVRPRRITSDFFSVDGI